LLGVDQPLVAGLVLQWVVMLLVVVVAGVLVVVGVVGVVNPLRMFWYVGELALSDRRLGDLPLGGRLCRENLRCLFLSSCLVREVP